MFISLDHLPTKTIHCNLHITAQAVKCGVTKQLLLADKCREDSKKNYKNRVQTEISSSDSGFHDAADRCKLFTSSRDVNSLLCSEICLNGSRPTDKRSNVGITLGHSFACDWCQLMKIFASWWECLDPVQCLWNRCGHGAVLSTMGEHMLSSSDPRTSVYVQCRLHFRRQETRLVELRRPEARA